MKTRNEIIHLNNILSISLSQNISSIIWKYIEKDEKKKYYVAYFSIAYYNLRKLLFIEKSIKDIDNKLKERYNTDISKCKKMDGYVCDLDDIKTVGIYNVNKDSLLHKENGFNIISGKIIILSIMDLLNINTIIETFDDLGQCDYVDEDDN
jgi:hypothetical protein